MKASSEFAHPSCNFIISSVDNQCKTILHNPTTLTLKELLDRFSDKLFYAYKDPWYIDSSISGWKESIVSGYDFAKAFLDNSLMAEFGYDRENSRSAAGIFLVPELAADAYKMHKIVVLDRLTLLYFKRKDYKQSSKVQRLKEIVDGSSDTDIQLTDTWRELVQQSYTNLVNAVYKSLHANLGDMTFAWEEVDNRKFERHAPYFTAYDFKKRAIQKSIYADDLTEDERAKAEKLRELDIYYKSNGISSEADLVKSRISIFESFRRLEFKRIFNNH